MNSRWLKFWSWALRLLWRGALVLLFSLLLTSLVWAGDLRIVDEQGLLRAVRNAPGPMTVIVQVDIIGHTSGVAPTLVLSNVDGISPDIKGREEGYGRFLFEGVKDGTWKLHVKPEQLIIREVRVAS